MNGDTLAAAKEETRNFLDSVLDLEQRISRDGDYAYGTKESGAVRRASLDLTRALAELRRSGG